jgi:hypothetical protein
MPTSWHLLTACPACNCLQVPVPTLGVDPAAVRAAIQHELRDWFLDAEFPPVPDGGQRDTRITLPVVFE